MQEEILGELWRSIRQIQRCETRGFSDRTFTVDVVGSFARLGISLRVTLVRLQRSSSCAFARLQERVAVFCTRVSSIGVGTVAGACPPPSIVLHVHSAESDAECVSIEHGVKAAQD